MAAVDPYAPTLKKTIGPVEGLKLAFEYRSYLPILAKAALSHSLGIAPVGRESWPLEIRLFHAGIGHAMSRRPKPAATDPPVDPLVAVKRIRDASNFHEWMPAPKDGVAATVEIPVTKRGYGGILEEFDTVEDGTRTVQAEWTASHRFLAEIAHSNESGNDSNSNSERVLLYFHGGAYLFMSPAAHRPLTIKISDAISCRVLSVDYRLAPETRFPGALHDAVVAFDSLLVLGVNPSNIILAGDSAGGNLANALALYLRDEVRAGRRSFGAGGVIGLSPWSDLTASLKSMEDNVDSDYLPLGDRSNNTMNPAHLFLSHEAHDNLVINPYVSPCIADLGNLPPMLLQVGAGEVLRDEIVLLASRAATAGTKINLEIYDAAFHVFQAFIKTEASRTAIRSMAAWVAALPSVDCKAVDYSTIDLLFATARLSMAAKNGKVKHISGTSTPPSTLKNGDSHSTAYVFIPQTCIPPAIKLRVDAHPLLIAAVEENAKNLIAQGDERKLHSTFYTATKVVGKGWRGMFGHPANL